MRFIQQAFDWADSDTWAWPDNDTKLLDCIADVEKVFGIVGNHVDTRTNPEHGGKTLSRKGCIQAGGACGVWPMALATMFEQVITIEPVKENFAALAWNIENTRNIYAVNGVLGSGQELGGRLAMASPPNELNNAGAQQVEMIRIGEDPTAYDNVHRVTKLNDFKEMIDVVDFLCLDLEGYELRALQGATQILKRDHPVILVEDKGLSRKFSVKMGYVATWLEGYYGYQVAEVIKRKNGTQTDVVLI